MNILSLLDLIIRSLCFRWMKSLLGEVVLSASESIFSAFSPPDSPSIWSAEKSVAAAAGAGAAGASSAC